LKKPLGNNLLGAKYSFVQREYYEKVVDGLELTTPNLGFIDLHKKPLYGKINLENEIIVPRLSFLKAYMGKAYTFDFVVDALEDLSNRLAERKEAGTLKRGTPYSNLDVTPRDSNWQREYSLYLKDVSKAYSAAYVPKMEHVDNIVDFESFTTDFLDFIALATPSFPVSFSQYYISRQSSIFPSGLAIDINSEQYGNDDTSYSTYMKDVNFPVFFQEAQNHGFILDRHAPWRLVVNLTSEPMQRYMKRRNYANIVDFFNQAYFSPLVAEFNEFVKLVNAVYFNTFPPESEYVRVCYKDGKTSHTVKYRDNFDPNKFTSLEEMMDYMGKPFWLRAFCFLKVREANKNFTQKEFDDFVDEVAGVNKYVDMKEALVYINKRIDPLKVSEFTGKPTFRF